MKMIYNPKSRLEYFIKHLIISIYCFIVIGLTTTFFLSDTYKDWAGEIQYGTASWYGNESICWKWGGHTKNGDIFDEDKLTCAMPDKEQINKWYRVTNVANNKSVKVWANDTGSFKKYDRIVDLSKMAFYKIADLEDGLIHVRIELSK